MILYYLTNKASLVMLAAELPMLDIIQEEFDLAFFARICKYCIYVVQL